MIAMRARIKDHGLVIKERVGQDAPICAQLLQRVRHGLQHRLGDKVQG